MAAPVMNRRQRRAAKKIGKMAAGAVEFLGAGVEHHRAGRLAEAEACYRQLLALQPDHADTLHLLGVIAYQFKRHEQAVELIDRAIKQEGTNSSYFYHLGLVLHEQGELDAAVAAYRQAIHIGPSDPEAYCNLGNALREQGRLEEAIGAYRQAIGVKADYAEAYSNLGVVLEDQCKLDEAIAAARRAISIKPDYAEPHNNLGNALEDQGKLDEAIVAYRRAIGIRPDYAEAHSNLGNALRQQGKLDEAITACGRAVGIKPDHAQAYSNLGNALRDQGKHEEAIAAYRKAIYINPDYAEAYSNLGGALEDQGKLDEVIAACRRAIGIKPDYAEAYCNLGVAMEGQGKLDEAIAAYRQATGIKPDYADAHSNLLFCLNRSDKVTAEQLFAAHLEWDERHGQQAVRPTAYSHNREPARRLRIGYVSPDFRQHSVAYFVEPLLQGHDRQQVEVFCYAEVVRPDQVTARLQGLADHWLTTVGLSDDAVAERIRADGIDILVDLAGHTAHNRLQVFARKPAPVQVTWLGYPNTTGLKAIDYRLVDAVTDPAGEADAFASETLVRLEGGFLCYAGGKDALEPAAPPCLKTGRVTFGSFNNPAKVSAATFDAWAALLTRLPQAQLLLKGKPFADDGTRMLCLQRLGERGVSADRVELMAQLPDPAAHLAAYHRVDIGLDPFPYNGTTTTCEALWMGVPVVTLRGDRHAGRVGASLLTQIGVSDLIAASVEEYVAIAAALAVDPGRLNELRQTLRARLAASPLCDGRAFASKVEAAFRAMWQQWCGAPGSGINYERNLLNEVVGTPSGHPPSERAAAEFFAAGIEHHQAGRLAQAEACYLRALVAQPEYADALNMLGVIAYQLGRSELAVEWLSRAIKQNGANPSCFSHLGLALQQQGKLGEAIAAYRQAIRIKPDYADAYSNLGTTLRDHGQLGEAVAAYRQAIGIQPEHADAHCNLGAALREQGKLDEAIAACRRAIGIKPDYALAHCNLGVALRDQGRHEEAIAAYHQAISIRPDLVEAHSNLGVSLRNLGKLDEAIAACRRAIDIKPDLAGAHFNLGNALVDQGEFDEAIAAYDQAIRIKPDHVDAHCGLGGALRDQGKLDEAIAACRRAIGLKPDSADAYCNVGVALDDQGKHEEAIAAFRQAIRVKADYAEAHSNLLFCLTRFDQVTSEQLFAAHREWDERYGGQLPRPGVYSNNREPGRRLRIGYVSPDFRQHSVAYFLEPLLQGHDRQQVEVFCYAEVRRPDQVTARLRELADHWLTTVGLSDDAVAERIRADGVDILVDLAGHTADNRLRVFARKPAPVQVTWLGYGNTTGLEAIDYRLVDAVTDPVGDADAFASETLVRLAGGFLCYGAAKNAPEPAAPPCLKAGTLTLGSFNNPVKVSVVTFDVWAALLARLPQAQLLLKGKPFADETTRMLFLQRLGERRVSADRVKLMPQLPDSSAHLAAYHQVDIGLDPFPYNGTTTTCEALWMGVPVVTLRGDRHAGRVGASLLTQIGLSDLIANSADEYVAIAAALAEDPARLNELRRSLRPRIAASPLCDFRAFARNIEVAYRTMWQQWCGETGS
jgi:protein O-GlcNAc transferase